MPLLFVFAISRFSRNLAIIIFCREELQDHLSIGNLTQLCVCFSRDDQSGGSPRYVQDNIRAQGATLVKLIEEQHAMVFVCGDARNMATDVNQAFVDIFCSQKGKFNNIHMEKSYATCLNYEELLNKTLNW